MQPLLYDSWLSAAKDNSVMQTDAAARNLDAAITMRFSASRGKPACIHAQGNRTRQQSIDWCHAAITLRSASTGSKTPRSHTHMNNHTLQNTKEEPIRAGTTPAAPASDTSCPSSPAAAILPEKTPYLILCPSFLPKTNPMPPSCSHHNAFCSIPLSHHFP